MELKSIITGIVQQLESNQIIPNITRVIKLLYLIEVEYYKVKQARLTNLKWKFYHYGPFPLEIYDRFKEDGIDLNNTQADNGYTFKKIQISESTIKEKWNSVNLLINNVVSEYGNLSIEALLDYVYFETEPMKNAHRREDLDFKLIKKEQIYVPNKTTPSKETLKKLKEIKEKLNPFLSQSIKYTNKPISVSFTKKEKPLIIKGKLTIE